MCLVFWFFVFFLCLFVCLVFDFGFFFVFWVGGSKNRSCEVLFVGNKQ